MKKIFTVLTLLLFFSVGDVFAQDTLKATSPQIAQAILKKIDHEVSLADKQSDQVFALLVERSQKFDQARASKNSFADRKPLYEEANRQALNKLKKILTTEQYDKFLLLRQQDEKQKEKYALKKMYKTDQDRELDF